MRATSHESTVSRIRRLFAFANKPPFERDDDWLLEAILRGTNGERSRIHHIVPVLTHVPVATQQVCDPRVAIRHDSSRDGDRSTVRGLERQSLCANDCDGIFTSE